MGSMKDAAIQMVLDKLNSVLVTQVELIKNGKSDLEKLEKNLRMFKAFRKDLFKGRMDEKKRELSRQIQSVVDEAECVVDSFVSHEIQNRNKSFIHRLFSTRTDIAKQVDSVCRKMEEIYGANSRFDIAFLNVDDGDAPDKTEAPILRELNVVGFEDEAESVTGFLAEKTDQVDIISIIGMPGLGKTTFAYKIFHHVTSQFKKRIWVHVSHKFKKEEIFLTILKEFTNITEEISRKCYQELAGLVANHLASEDFLLVMDDVWTTADWDELKIALPSNKSNKKAKVLITSRQVDVGRYANRLRSPHMLRFLTHIESCELLQLEVFGKREFPVDLLFEGTEIAKKCGGVPLAIVVIGGFLAKKFLPYYNMGGTRRTWRKVFESFNTYVYPDNDKRMENIMSLSYQMLPDYLKQCFLYVGIFPEGFFEIPVSKLIKLWIAEGLIHRRDNISLEEIAESYLEDLINRNLIRAVKFKAGGGVKTCCVHDLLHYFCITEAGNRMDNFFEVIKISSDGGFQPPVSEGYDYRRLCIHSDVSRFLKEKPRCPTVRTFVSFSNEEVPIQPEYISAIPANFKQLRVFEAKPIIFTKFPHELYQLVHLKYLVLSSTLAVLPSDFAMLRNIETLTVNTTSHTLDIKVDILNMVQLRHFKTNASATLSKPVSSSRGEQIQTLGTISPQSCSEEVFSMTRKLKKLGVRGELDWLLVNENGSFDSLRRLDNLEKLKLMNDSILFPNPLGSLPPPNNFPPKLRELTLCDTSLDWAHMSVLASLDKLEVLKLKDKAFWGETWEMTGGGFHHLEILHIGRTNLRQWIASHHHFPKLTNLKLEYCENLIEVPIQLAYIPNFQSLDLHLSRNAANSAKKIHGIKRSREDEQPTNGRRFKVSISPPDGEEEM